MNNINNSVQSKVYNADDLTIVLDLSKPKIYQLFKTKGFPVLKIGTRCVVPIDALDKWINEQTGKSTIK